MTNDKPGPKVLESIARLCEYLSDDERKHSDRCDGADGEGHIWREVLKVQNWLETFGITKSELQAEADRELMRYTNRLLASRGKEIAYENID